jgi:hypothetical protein
MEKGLSRFARLAMAVARRCVPLRLTRFAHPIHPSADLFAMPDRRSTTVPNTSKQSASAP